MSNKEISEKRALILAQRYMLRFKQILAADPDYQQAVVQASLENPKALVTGIGIRFPRLGGEELRVKVETEADRNKLRLTRYLGGGEEEQVTVLLELGRRREPVQGAIQHMRMCPRKEYSCETNTLEAVRRTRRFLQEL